MMYAFLMLVSAMGLQCESDPRAHVEVHDPRMVQVSDQRTYVCSGALIGNGKVLTAAHCAHGKVGDPLFVQYSDATSEKYKILYIGNQDTGEDLAILQGPTGTHPVFQVSGNPLPVHESTVFGSYRDDDHQAMVPVFAMGVEHGRLILLGHIYPGDSGGPVLNRDGAIVGVISAKPRTNCLLGLAVPLETILKTLERLK